MHSFLELAKGVKYFNFEYCQILWQQIAVLHHRYGLHRKRRTIVLFIQNYKDVIISRHHLLIAIDICQNQRSSCLRKEEEEEIYSDSPAC